MGAHLLDVSVGRFGFHLGSPRAERMRGDAYEEHLSVPRAGLHVRQPLCHPADRHWRDPGELARLLGVTERTIQTWEGGSNYPKVDSLKHFIALCLQHQAFAAGREEEEIRAVWKAAHTKVLLDESWLRTLLGSLPPEDPTSAATAPAASSAVPVSLMKPSAAAFPRIDWIGALDVSAFRGRATERAQLTQWILQEGCRLVVVLGMGGIGKSVLVSMLGLQLSEHFEAVLWRSVRDAPSCEELVADCISFFAETPPAELPVSLERRIDQLVAHLYIRRCLLVLDNLETLLREGDHEGNYLPGYEGYGRLLQRLAETAHQSCVLVTSREKPKEIGPLEGSRSPIRSLRLVGLDEQTAQALLSDKGLVGAEDAWRQLIATYAGNPLALKIIGETIVDLFGGDIAQFLQSGELVFNSVRAMLHQQVQRLTPLEQVLLTWLAVVREWTSFDTLLQLLIPRPVHRQAMEALEALWRRSLLERGQQAVFTLPSVVMEYSTSALIEQMAAEMVTGKVEALRHYALEQAQAKDYVRQIQLRLLVRPLLERLRAELEQDRLIEEHLMRLLDHFRTEEETAQGYGPANVISVLKELRGDLRELDLSRLSIRGAYLQGVQMQDATLAGAHFHEVVFTDTFDAVLSVTVSPDGSYWAAGSNSGQVRVWREEGRTAHLMLRAHTDRLGAVAFGPGGHTLASASWDGTIKLWHMTSGAATWARRGHDDYVTSIAFHPDGRLLASGSYDGTVRIWDVSNGTSRNILPKHGGPILAIAWSPDGRLLGSSGLDRTIKLWEAASGTLLQAWQGHSALVAGLAFAPDGTLLASCSLDQTVKLWEVETGTCVGSLQGHADSVLSLAFIPGGSTLLSGSYDRTLREWEAASGQCLRIIQGYAVTFFDVDWSPDGGYLVSGSSDATLTVWSVAEGTAVQILHGHTQLVSGVAWSSDGRLLASSSWDQTVRIWDMRIGACVRMLQGHTGTVGGVRWSPDGRLLASGSNDQTVRVWDVQAGVNLWTGREHRESVNSLSWSPDGTRLASCSDDRTVLVWQATDGSVLLRLRRHEGPVYNVAWSPDGTRLASCGGSERGGELFVWDAVGGDSVANLGACVRRLKGCNSPVSAVAWSPEGELLVSGNTDGMLRWWDVAQGKSVATVQAHDGWVRSIQVSPDGRMAASCGEPGVIKLWDIQSRQHISTIRSNRPYERLTIIGVTGLTEAQKVTLRALGAVE